MYAKILGSHMAMINGAKIKQFLLIHTRFRQLPLPFRVNSYICTKILVCTIWEPPFET